jgi:signal transduction histidine kinase
MSAAIHLSPDRSAASADTASSIDARIVAFMRCVLALSGLAIIYIDPTEPARFVELTYTSLSAYSVWSLFQLVAAHRGSVRQSPWIDVACATYLVALTQGTSSIFFFLFLFAILVASFSGGYRQGLRVAIASTALFTVVGTLFAPDGADFELNRSMIRPVYLLALGWMMAVWGGRELVLRRRLALLRDISGQWNARSGVRGTVEANLERILEFFEAIECLLIARKGGAKRDGSVVYKVAATADGLVKTITDLEMEATAMLLGLPPEASIAYDVAGRPRPDGVAQQKCAELANLFDAQAFATVHYRQGDGTEGRLFVVRKDAPFTDSELAFLEQVVVAVSHVVENTQLIDELVLKAAEHERFRISLDIHDSTVQPYIGLKLGLDALSREAQANPLHGRIVELLDMANDTIRDLRGFATGIRDRAPISGESLLNALREQAARFQRYYGVEVHLECDQNLFISPHLASEAFRMITEGLSNVMRHTTARNAFVRISRQERELRLIVANEPWTQRGPRRPFTPRSINSRAIALGGSSLVELRDDGHTAIHVAIPV